MDGTNIFKQSTDVDTNMYLMMQFADLGKVAKRKDDFTYEID